MFFPLAFLDADDTQQKPPCKIRVQSPPKMHASDLEGLGCHAGQDVPPVLPTFHSTTKHINDGPPSNAKPIQAWDTEIAKWVTLAPSGAWACFTSGPEALCRRLVQQSASELQGVLQSCARRRVKGDRDPEVLAWMEGVVLTILSVLFPCPSVCPGTSLCPAAHMTPQQQTSITPVTPVQSRQSVGLRPHDGFCVQKDFGQLRQTCKPAQDCNHIDVSSRDHGATPRMDNIESTMKAVNFSGMDTHNGTQAMMTAASCHTPRDAHSLMPHQLSRAHDELLKGLTPAQVQAATFPPDSALLIVACAGSGKTKTLLARVRWLLASRAVETAGGVLLLSFSRTACNEMQHRLRALDKGLAMSVRVRTFHAFCLELLRDNRDFLIEACTVPELYRLKAILESEELRVISESEQLQLISSCLQSASATMRDSCEGRLNPQRYSTCSPSAISSVHRFIQLCKSRGIPPRAAQGGQLALLSFAEYEEKLDSLGAVDFNDLVSLACKALQHSSALCDTICQRVEAVVIDEFQDTSVSQLELLQMLIRNKPSKLTAVGDPRQRIFSFQGSFDKQFEDFACKFQAATITLDENFRSTANICKFAGSVLGRRHDNGPHGSAENVIARHPKGSGCPVAVVVCRTPACETCYIQTQILHARLSGHEWRDIGVLSRTVRGAKFVAETLSRVGIPIVLAGVEHYSRREVEDIGTICRLALQPTDDHLARHSMGILRLLNAQEISQLEAARLVGRQPFNAPDCQKANYMVMKRIAQTLAGHESRRKRFLLQDPPPLAELIKELRAAVFPKTRHKQRHKSGVPCSPVSDEALRSALLLNGIAFKSDKGEVIWPAPRSACHCRGSSRRAANGTYKKLGSVQPESMELEVPRFTVPMCTYCGGITSHKDLPGNRSPSTDMACNLPCCTSCGMSLRSEDPRCLACGHGQHLDKHDAHEHCIPPNRRPHSDGKHWPWLCAACYANYAAAWLQQVQSSGFSQNCRTVRSIMCQIPDDAPELGLPTSSFWDLCTALAALECSPAWLDKGIWKRVCRFVRVVSNLNSRVEELRLPEFLSRVLAVLPKGRRYQTWQARQTGHGAGKTTSIESGEGSYKTSKVSSAGPAQSLEAVLHAEAELHLREAAAVAPSSGPEGRWQGGDDSAKAQLRAFLERLEIEGCQGFAETSTGSATTEVGKGRDAVTVATVHAAKGRQWRSVFVVQFNDETGFPLINSSASQGAETQMHLQEEQRLAYVATSRACERLAVSYAFENQEGQVLKRSRFLDECWRASQNGGAQIVSEQIEFPDVSKLQQLTTTVRSAGLFPDTGDTGVQTAWQKFLANPRKPNINGRFGFKRNRFAAQLGASKRRRMAAALSGCQAAAAGA